jgi:hypothetical protein
MLPIETPLGLLPHSGGPETGFGEMSSLNVSTGADLLWGGTE